MWASWSNSVVVENVDNWLIASGGYARLPDMEAYLPRSITPCRPSVTSRVSGCGAGLNAGREGSYKWREVPGIQQFTPGLKQPPRLIGHQADRLRKSWVNSGPAGLLGVFQGGTLRVRTSKSSGAATPASIMPAWDAEAAPPDRSNNQGRQSANVASSWHGAEAGRYR